MPKNLRILYHFRVRGAGAEGVHIAGIVNGFRALDNSVSLVSPTNVDPTVPPLVSDDNNYSKLSIVARLLHTLADFLPEPFFEIMELFYNPLAGLRLRRAVVRERADFIYERFAFFNFAGALIAGWMNIPLVVEVNELCGHKRVRAQRFVGIARRIEKFVFNRASLIITVSNFLNEEIRNMVGPQKQIVTIPNGVPGKWLEDEPSIQDIECLRRKYNLERQKVICFIGGLVYWHNFDLLLEAVKFLQEDIPEVLLLIVGDGPAKEYIMSKAQDLGLKTRSLLLTGRVPHFDIPKYISLADVAVIPETNNFRSPIKLFEYMAMAKPVVAPRMPAIEAVISHGKDGFLFKPGEYISLKKYLSIVLSDSDLLQKIGSKAKEKVFSSFTWENHANNILKNLGY